MSALIVPESEPVEQKPTVKIITALEDIEIDPEELEKARKSVQSSSKVIVLEAEVKKAIQQQIAGWTNWFALFYPQMPKAFDAALKVIGYKVTKET